MGADMILYTLWIKNVPTTDEALVLGKLREVLVAEQDKEIFKRAIAFAKNEEYDPKVDLFSEVTWAMKTTGSESIERIYDLIIDGYATHLKDLYDSLDSREVTAIWARNGITGYATGGLSWGDDFPVGGLWSRILFDNDLEFAPNPYADFLYNNICVDPTFYPQGEMELLKEKILKQEELIRELTLNKA